MIPKKLHYCWFGGRPLPKLAQRCIESWKRLCPDYELLRWDEDNSPLEDNLYVRQAYQMKKWAFVSDYVRLYALEKHGGVYLDTDVELLRPPDPFLEHEVFLGFESPEKLATCVIGSVPGHLLIQQLMGGYSLRSFQLPDGNLDETTNVISVTRFFTDMGLCRNGTGQAVKGAAIYPMEYFSPKDLETGRLTITANTVAIHHFDASWMSPRQRFHTRVAQKIGPENTRKIKRLLGRES